MKKIIDYLWHNFSLAAWVNAFDGYCNGPGYKFYLSQKVMHRGVPGRIFTVYHRWCADHIPRYCISSSNGPDVADMIYLVEHDGSYLAWDCTEDQLIPVTDAVQALYGQH